LSPDSQELKNRNIVVGDRATIGYGAKIGDRATIGYGAKIGDRATIGYGAKIGDRATIGYGAELLTNIYINTIPFPITYCGNSRISIGCKNMTADKWLEKGLEIAEQHDFTEKQITQYRKYIEMIKSVYC